jgi:hypothetical protein
MDLDTLSDVLLALVSGFPERAESLLATARDLDDDERSVLLRAVSVDGTRVARCRSLGDALRGMSVDRALPNECYRAAFWADEISTDMLDNTLFANFASSRDGVAVDKWPHYFPIYEQHLARFRGTAARVLEIGVFRGGGLRLLRRYLGADAVLVGLDIDPVAVEAARGYTVVLGDQEDPTFLEQVHRDHGPFDVVIDDGGHVMRQQIVSIETLLPLMPAGGTYLVEDTHTSYWQEFGGSLRGPSTFVEWSKDVVDQLHAYHWSTATPPSPLVDLVGSVHFYDSIVVFNRSDRLPPFNEVAGNWAHLRMSRPQELVTSELLATRDLAVSQRDAAERRASAASEQATEAEQRRAEADARRVQAGNEAALAAAERDMAIEQLQVTRNSASWRVTAPWRRLRTRLSRRG